MLDIWWRVAANRLRISGLIIGIDASNLREGGGITHLMEFLDAAEPHKFGISEFVVWGCSQTLDKVRNRPWLKKNTPSALNLGLWRRLIWQRFNLADAARQAGCDLLFVPGGNHFCTFRPVVTMSRNLLPFEPDEMRRFGWSFSALRFALLRFGQVRSFQSADGVIFLTNYAKQRVLEATGQLNVEIPVIPHGVATRFMLLPRRQRPISEHSDDNPLRLLYVSMILMYKHQWNVVEAVAALRKKGYSLILDLVGPAQQSALDQLNRTIEKLDPVGEWVRYHGNIPYCDLHLKYSQADIGIFASSCENMPNILLETMAAGLPIACSNRGPMPEILGSAGDYFDPEQPHEIERALTNLIVSPALRREKAQASYLRVQDYSWQRCTSETLSFLTKIARQHRCKSGAKAV